MMSPAKELERLSRVVRSVPRRALLRDAAKYIRDLEDVLRSGTQWGIETAVKAARAEVETAATLLANRLLIDRDTAAQARIRFLEDSALHLDSELRESREAIALAQSRSRLYEDRWMSLMQRSTVPLITDQTGPGFATTRKLERCDGCGNEIDPAVCGCGGPIPGCGHDGGHPSVPMGCNCYRVPESDI